MLREMQRNHFDREDVPKSRLSPGSNVGADFPPGHQVTIDQSSALSHVYRYPVNPSLHAYCRYSTAFFASMTAKKNSGEHDQLTP